VFFDESLGYSIAFHQRTTCGANIRAASALNAEVDAKLFKPCKSFVTVVDLKCLAEGGGLQHMRAGFNALAAMNTSGGGL
jgi:hypothetical protein